MKLVAAALLLLAAMAAIGYFVYATEKNPESAFRFRLGLDLAGGTHLVYRADTSKLPPAEVDDAMSALRDVVERRVNLFGANEPIVQVEESSVFAEGGVEKRLIVELPGVTDIDEAIRIIGETPLLEFKLVNERAATSTEEGASATSTYIDTGFTGRFIERAQLSFGNGAGALANEPVVVVRFTSEGKERFAKITTEHVGERLAIFLDGKLLSTPVINEPITGGAATISGNFTPEEARDLVKNLNLGALPVPITLASSQTVDAALGEDTLRRGVRAAAYGALAVALFLIIWYRVPGIVAVVALAAYVAVMFALFKVVPVTLTAAGLAGFILSIGMAVDANVLIFERLKEEMRLGKKLEQAIRDAFSRAWPAIRDGNLSSILTAIVLFWFGTSIVEGFALTFGLGVVVSMLTAISFTRTLLLALSFIKDEKLAAILFGNGWRS